MPATEFTDIFRDEHRQLRDMLLGLINAFESSDSEQVRQGIEEMAAHAAPHFLYEQEALYPALVEVHGDEYVDRLLEEHDEALEAAQKLAELAEQEELDEEAAEYGIDLVRQLLPHVSDRDGLAVMVEVLEPEAIEKISKAQKESRGRGVSLASLAKRRKSMAKTTRVAKVEAKARRSKAAPKRSVKPARATAKKAATRAGMKPAKRRDK